MQDGNALFFIVAHTIMIVINDTDAMVISVAIIVQISTIDYLHAYPPH